MIRVLVLQNRTPDGPGYLGQWPSEQRVAFDVFNTEAGDAYLEAVPIYETRS